MKGGAYHVAKKSTTTTGFADTAFLKSDAASIVFTILQGSFCFYETSKMSLSE